MKLTIFGTGYVGLVTGACLAEIGHDVLCIDIDEDKIAALKAGIVPLYEPGLQPLVTRNLAAGTLAFSTDAARGVAHAPVIFIAVGTPPGEDGSADLGHVLGVARTIAGAMDADRILVMKSTVPVGTADAVAALARTVLSERGLAHGLEIVSNPEFLKEGSAVADFMRPDRTIIGTVSGEAEAVMREIYEPFNRNHDRLLVMEPRSAELTKYAANAMLATKISFMNEIAGIAERLGADIDQVRRGIGADPRIGHHFIYAGMGYGGSCFPKDVRALIATAAANDVPTPLLGAVADVNARQRSHLFGKILRHYGSAAALAGRTFAVWGLAFKPNTDDLREAPSLDLIEALWAAGAKVQAFDPAAGGAFAARYSGRDDYRLVTDRYSALDGADALCICTEWQQFRAPDFEEMARRLTRPVIFDGRNLYAPQRLAEQGWAYYGIGRGL
ncbi:UDP-glucose/GDP-mannose dehydrogenase family protein [Arsenicitalea aurantiaca]|uniref:UDP-glucose 6-dehydrogenase n=1 Tax=Arsenicitalea aurantiaca TaxID=1783274 RepID=A0A433XL69_9HYPH|nr:UDP-glucose/GDP-mannose dehydrogenase family protein [Arsenicitalea aurantiaca]RUT34826.1 UDP-glucose/GDP-mannose dehydrogenase family protein [Arsenicitalea aurantiaca]